MRGGVRCVSYRVDYLLAQNIGMCAQFELAELTKYT